MGSVKNRGRAMVSMGANVDDACKRVGSAIEFLRALLDDFECSHIYETPCMGNASAPAYTNAVVCGTTLYGSEEVARILKAYESINGRVRGKGERVAIDLDLVVWDEEILRERDFNALHFKIGLKEIKSWAK